VNHFPVLSVMLWLPLVAALVILFVPALRTGIIRYIALAASIGSFVLSLVVIFSAKFTPDLQWEENFNWLPSVGIRYHLGTDGLSTLFLLLTGFTSVIACVASWDSIKTNIRPYFVTLLLLETGMYGVFMTFDLFLFYVFWELVLIPMALIIGVWGSANRVYAAIKFFLFTLAGSLLMLVAIVALYTQYYTRTGIRTLDLQALTSIPGGWSHTFQLWTFAAFFIAFAIKVPMFPVHTWLPDAHTESPTTGSVILAAVLLKMGGYGMIRFCLTMFPYASRTYATAIIILSVIAIIYGALVAMVQPDMKRLVAYSSVTHMGFTTLGIFVFNAQGMQGAVINMFSHGMVTGGLFLCVGVLYERAHTRLISAFGGIANRMPIYAAMFMVFMLGGLGLPGLSGFVGEFLSMLGSFRLHNKTYAAISAFVVVFAAIYMMWMYKRVIFGVAKESSAGFLDLTRVEVATLVPLMIGSLYVGIYPAPIMRLLQPFINVLLAPFAGINSFDAGGSFH
jgi:NADH-quinone oxidoreductase subunit M